MMILRKHKRVHSFLIITSASCRAPKMCTISILVINNMKKIKVLKSIPHHYDSHRCHPICTLFWNCLLWRKLEEIRGLKMLRIQTCIRLEICALNDTVTDLLVKVLATLCSNESRNCWNFHWKPWYVATAHIYSERFIVNRASETRNLHEINPMCTTTPQSLTVIQESSQQITNVVHSIRRQLPARMG